jgi:hypothetical protein
MEDFDFVLMLPKTETREFVYKGKTVVIEYEFLESERTGEQFVTTEIEERNYDKIIEAFNRA